MTPQEMQEIIDRRGWSIKEFADALFVDPTTVGRWLAGITSPKASLQRRLRELLDNARKRDKGAKVAQ